MLKFFQSSLKYKKISQNQYFTVIVLLRGGKEDTLWEIVKLHKTLS